MNRSDKPLPRPSPRRRVRQNISRLIDAYAKSPPEKRDEAGIKVMRQIQAEAVGLRQRSPENAEAEEKELQELQEGWDALLKISRSSEK